MNNLITYRDAGNGPDDFPITVFDCLGAFAKAKEMGWYNHSSFSVTNFTKMLKNGDLSWIVPGKIIACPSPVSNGMGKAMSHTV